MADTRNFAVSPKKSWSRSTSYRDDPFTVEDGHYVGHDRFVVPNSFAEFYQRFPACVANWVRNRTRGCTSRSEAEDWTQQLLLFLAALPANSIHRKSGKRDVIQTFAPEKMHGANEARFRSFINRCLSNEFNTLYKKWRTQPHSNPNYIPFSTYFEGGVDDGFCHSNSTNLRARQRRSRETYEQRLRLDEFVRRWEPSIPGLGQLVGIFGETGSWEETANLLGREQCARIRRAARQLAMSVVWNPSRTERIHTGRRPPE